MDASSLERRFSANGPAAGTVTLVVDKETNNISPANARSYRCSIRRLVDAQGNDCSIVPGAKCASQPGSLTVVTGKIE